MLWATTATVMALLLISSAMGLPLRSASARILSQSRWHLVSRLSLTTNVFIVGKKSVKEDWIGHGYSEYEARLTPNLKLHTHFVKTDQDLVKLARMSKGVVFALDESGRTLSSTEFSAELFKAYERGGSHVDFVIGSFEGLPVELKNSLPLLSLSRMTWPHQMARLLLVEQIYRAFEIRKGSPYHH